MCDNNKNQDIKLSHGKIDLMSSYFKKNEEEDCMDVTQKSIHLKTIYVDEDFECLLWQRNWWWDRQIWDHSVPEVLEEDRVIRDSQRLGLWRSWDIRLEVADGKHSMDTRKRPPPLNAETLARMFNCQDECGDMRTRMVEAVAVLLVVLSVILFVFMGHGDESNLGGKTAAIQFYYNSLELARNNSFGFY